jgi:aminobenzoyl-glutamate utilization protein A
MSRNASNVIADHVTFELELRGQTTPIVEYVTDAARNILQGVAVMHGVETAVTLVSEAIAVENDRDLMLQVEHAASQIGIDNRAIVEEYLVPGSEDATFIMHEVQQHGGQASYVCIGSPTSGGHHTSTFDFDEDLLVWGVRLLWQWVKNVASPNRR